MASIVGKEKIIPFEGLSLYNVLHVLKISYNLLSISKITCELNCKATILPDSISFQDLNSGKMINTAQHNSRLYLLSKVRYGLATIFFHRVALSDAFPSGASHDCVGCKLRVNQWFYNFGLVQPTLFGSIICLVKLSLV